VVLVLAVGALAGLGLAGCGARKSIPGDLIPGQQLTVYLSVPSSGASKVDAASIMSGAQLALTQSGGNIGRYQVRLRQLDDASATSRGWDPGQTTDNARLAVTDPTTIGYIGELNSGATAVSLPILNRAGIAQISPASTAVGLTSEGPSVSPGEPGKYYPTGVRTFARVAPNDAVQAVAQAKLQREQGCNKTYVVDDGEVDGLDTAATFETAAQSAGPRVIGTESYDPTATDYASFASGVASSGADCILLSAVTESNAVKLTQQLAAALPQAKLFGSAGVGESTYTDPAQGGIARALDGHLLITLPTLAPADYPPAGQAFFKAYSQRYGTPQPDAIYGYEAMSLLLDAVARATAGGTKPARRSNVVTAIFKTHNRHSVLGTYGIDHDGDTTLKQYGVYRVQGGRLVFWKAVEG
jgi:branched-chain amino acid transport system substrate-binding protein